MDKEFLDKYCVGYDEDTMPESAKGQNKSYKDYIMGTGYDMVEKTPEWAAAITQIPADRIRQLAARHRRPQRRCSSCRAGARNATTTARTPRVPSACCPSSRA